MPGGLSDLRLGAIDGAQAARFTALKLLATLRETFWGVTAEWSRTSALSPEAAAAYVDENYAKFTAAREAFEACVRAHS